MARGTYSGEDIIKALGNWRFRRVDQVGDHVKLRYRNPDTDEVRNVTVPLHDELSTDTLHRISQQAGASDFQKFLDAMDEMI